METFPGHPPLRPSPTHRPPHPALTWGACVVMESAEAPEQPVLRDNPQGLFPPPRVTSSSQDFWAEPSKACTCQGQFCFCMVMITLARVAGSRRQAPLRYPGGNPRPGRRRIARCHTSPATSWERADGAIATVQGGGDWAVGQVQSRHKPGSWEPCRLRSSSEWWFAPS